MEEILDTNQRQEGAPPLSGEQQYGIPKVADSAFSFPGISFTPPRENGSTSFPSFEIREKCAFVGIVFGCISVISWTVIMLGIIISAVGIIFSILGIKSSRAKIARAGLALSAAGGAATIIYVVFISLGIINYNYFTNEFWGIPSGGVQVIE